MKGIFGPERGEEKGKWRRCTVRVFMI